MNSKLKEIHKYISNFEKDLKKPEETGSYYTDYRAAYHIVSEVLKGRNKEDLLKSYYLEPSNGGGIFTFAFITYLEEIGLTRSEVEEIMNKRYLYSELQESVADKFEEILQKYDGGDYNFNIHKHIGSTLNLEQEDMKYFFGNEFNGFHFIFGNPPYGFNDKEAKQKMSKDYKNLPNDIYGLFYIHCYNLLAQDGVMGLITPRSYYAIKTFHSVREVILKDIISITNCPVEIFKNEITKKNPSIETTITLIEKNTKKGEYDIYSLSKDFVVSHTGKINKSDSILCGGIVLSDIKEDNMREIRYVFKHKKCLVSDLFDSAMGIKTADNKRFVISEKKSENYLPFFKGSSKYDQSYTSLTEGFLSLEELRRHKLKNTAIPQEKFLSLGIERIGVPEIGHKGIVQSFLYKNGYPSNSIWIYQTKEGVNEKWLYVLLGLLNSNLYKTISSFYSSGFRIEKHDIDKLPLFFTEEESIFEEIYVVVKDILDGRIEKEVGSEKINNLIKIYINGAVIV